MGDAATISQGMVIIYDGQCPFCSAYVRMLRLREGVGAVRLVDARSADPAAREAIEKNFDLDKGMVVTFGGRTYYGDGAMHFLAIMSSPSGLANRTLSRIFRSQRAARVLYPALVAGRRFTLYLLGRHPIGLSVQAQHDSNL